MPKIGNKTIQYKIYRRSNGVAQYVDDTTSYKRPALESLSDTISGAGINGEIDLPTIAQLASMEIELAFKNVNDKATALFGQETQEIEARWVTDVLDSKSGSITHEAKKDIVKFIPKSLDMGNIEVNAGNEGSITGEVLYFKHIVNGRALVEIDKLANVFKINGVDYAASIREAL